MFFAARAREETQPLANSISRFILSLGGGGDLRDVSREMQDAQHICIFRRLNADLHILAAMLWQFAVSGRRTSSKCFDL